MSHQVGQVGGKASKSPSSMSQRLSIPSPQTKLGDVLRQASLAGWWSSGHEYPLLYPTHPVHSILVTGGCLYDVRAGELSQERGREGKGNLSRTESLLPGLPEEVADLLPGSPITSQVPRATILAEGGGTGAGLSC